jgi:hypothetical protein
MRDSALFRSLGSSTICALQLSPVTPPGFSQAPVVPSARLPAPCGPRLRAAQLPAVLLTAIVTTADVERPQAPQARQLVRGGARVHPTARMNKNWTATSGSATLPGSHPTQYPKAQALTWAFIFSPTPPVYWASTSRANSRQIGTRRPAFPLKVVPTGTGGDTRAATLAVAAAPSIPTRVAAGETRSKMGLTPLLGASRPQPVAYRCSPRLPPGRDGLLGDGSGNIEATERSPDASVARSIALPSRVPWLRAAA